MFLKQVHLQPRLQLPAAVFLPRAPGCCWEDIPLTFLPSQRGSHLSEPPNSQQLTNWSKIPDFLWRLVAQPEAVPPIGGTPTSPNWLYAARRRGQGRGAAAAIRARRGQKGSEGTCPLRVCSTRSGERGTEGQTRGNAEDCGALAECCPRPASRACVPNSELSLPPQTSRVEVVSLILFSRSLGPKLQEKEEPPNMASEVCRTSGTLQTSGEEPLGLTRAWGHLPPDRPAVIQKFPTTLPKPSLT